MQNRGLKQLVEKQKMILDTTMHSVLLSIVATTVYKALYRTGMKRIEHKYTSNNKRASIPLKHETHFELFGLKSVAEMKLFAATVRESHFSLVSCHDEY